MSLLGEAWAAVGGAPGAEAVLGLHGPARVLPGPHAVGDLAVATAGAALLAAAELASARLPGGPPSARLDTGDVAASFTSERDVRLDGRPPGELFAATSAFFRTADGWIRTHGNYPHHGAALRRALGLADDAGAPEVGRALADRPAAEAEAAIVAAGGCAAAVRSAGAWASSPMGAATAAAPLVAWTRGAGSGGRALPDGAWRTRPAAGLRVLDLTRVIAGPVAGRTLAALGADVLRVDPPGLDELLTQVLDGGPGKRTARLDVHGPAGRERFEALLRDADVLLHGYRPGTLDLTAIGERHPHLTLVSLSAWGTAGPWATRRGFDSLVQAATGIAAELADDAGRPGALPCQALDHGTGHLMAAAALRGLTERARTGCGAHASLALARTAAWLLDAPRVADDPPGELPRPSVTLASPLGRVALVPPPGTLDGEPLRWAHGPRPLGADPPAFADA